MGKAGLIERPEQGKKVARFTRTSFKEVRDGLLAEWEPTPFGPLTQQVRAFSLSKVLESIGGAPGQSGEQVRKQDSQFHVGIP